MYCSDLDRLLEIHSALTFEFFRQEGRTEEFYASDHEWLAECKRLQELEQQLQRVSADIVAHRQRHACAQSSVLATEFTEEAEKHASGHDFTRAATAPV